MEKFIKRAVATAALCALATGPALAQSIGEKSGADKLVGIAPSTSDFVKEAAISDMFEIRSSDLATQKSDAATQTFAKQMMTDHQKTSDELKTLIQSAHIDATPPAALDSKHQSMLDKLTKENDKDFTKGYRDDQVKAHKDAVSLFQRYAKGGDNPQLKDWAGKTLPILQHHLQMAQALDNLPIHLTQVPSMFWADGSI